MFKRLLIILFFCYCKLCSYSQPICDITHYDGLRNNVWSITSVLQDQNNFMWFSTTNGLYRFDGYTFQCFKSIVGDHLQMTSNRIKHTYQDANGGLWCLIDNRVFLFNTENYIWCDVLAELEKSNKCRYVIEKIRVMANGQVWLIDNAGKYIMINSSNPLKSAHVVKEMAKYTDTFICTDSEGNTCLFTSSASYLYRNGVLKKYDTCIIDNAFSNNRMWMLDNKGKLNVFNSDNEKIERVECPVPDESFYRINSFSNGLLILLSNDKVYARSTDGTWHNLNISDSIERFTETSSGYIWIQTSNNKLYRLNLNAYQVELIDNKCDKSAFLHEDAYGTLWILNKSGLLFYIVSGSRQIEQYDTGLDNLQIGNVYVDKQGNLWNLNNYGIFKLTFSKKRYEQLQTPNLLHVKSVYVDNKGRCWIAERNNKTVAIYSKDNTLLGYLGKDGIISKKHVTFSNIYSIFQDSRERIWLGSKQEGLYCLTETDNGSYVVENFLPDSNNIFSISGSSIYHINEDSRGRIWIATHGGGINCIENHDSANIKFINSNNILSKYNTSYNKKIYKITFTNDDIMLAASNKGLLIADAKLDDLSLLEIKHHKRESDRKTSLSSSYIRSIFCDSKQRIFVCTENDGVNQIISTDLLADKLDFRHFSQYTGFPTDLTQYVIENEDQLWVVGRNILAELNPDKKDEQYMSIAFESDKHVFSEALPVQLYDGRWMFGLQNDGVLILDVTMKKQDSFVPNIVLSNVKIGNKEYYGNSDTIVLQYHERDLIINFAAIDYSNSRNIDYAYMMDDDTSWTYLGSTNNVSFIDVLPGVYQLKLRSTDGDGVWNDRYRTLTIDVKPTFWETGWAYLLYLLTIIGIGYSIVLVRHHIKKIKKQREESLESYLKLLDQNEKEQKAYDEKRRELQARNSQVYDDICMQRVISFIKDNIGNPNMSIDDVAAFAAISRSALNRKVKQNTGVTPLEFIKTIRMQRACQMLKEEQYTVNEVAYECGFSDPKYFSKCFKSVIGLTPTDYRLKNLI